MIKFAMVRARGTRIGGGIYGLDRYCQDRGMLSKCKDSNVFPPTPAGACKVRPVRDESARFSLARAKSGVWCSSRVTPKVSP